MTNQELYHAAPQPTLNPFVQEPVSASVAKITKAIEHLARTGQQCGATINLTLRYVEGE